jgi:hypothetical protein
MPLLSRATDSSKIIPRAGCIGKYGIFCRVMVFDEFLVRIFRIIICRIINKMLRVNPRVYLFKYSRTRRLSSPVLFIMKHNGCKMCRVVSRSFFIAFITIIVAQTLIPHVIIGGTIRDKTKATLPSVVVFGVVELKKLGILKLLLRDKVSMVDVTSRYFPVDSFVGRAN